MYELFEAVERDPELVYWRQGRSLPYGEGVSFWALGEMVKAHAGHPRDGHEGGGRAEAPRDRRDDRAGRRRRVDARAPPSPGRHRGRGRAERQPGRGVRGLARLPRGDRRPEPARPRLRGPPLGRRRPARLRRPPRRLGDARPAARRRHRPPGAAHAASRLGRRQDERAHALARAALAATRPRSSCTRSSSGRDPRRRPGDAARARRRQPAVRGGVRPPARRARRRRRAPGDRAGHHRRPPRRARPRGEGAAPGRGRARPGVLGRGPRARSAARQKQRSIASSDGSSSSASGGAPSRARRSTHSGTRSSARSPTSRSHARSVARSTAASPTGSRRSAAPRISPSCSRITTSPCSSTRSRTRSSPRELRARWARRATERSRSTRIRRRRASTAARSSSLADDGARTAALRPGQRARDARRPRGGGHASPRHRELLVEAGDPETAAEAECVLAQIGVRHGRRPGVTRHVAPCSRARARAPALRRARAERSRRPPGSRCSAESWSDAVETGGRQNGWPTELGLDAIRADALATVGTARATWAIHAATPISRPRSSWPRQPTHRWRCPARSTTSPGGTRASTCSGLTSSTERNYEAQRRYGHVRRDVVGAHPARRHGLRTRTLGRGARARRGRDRLRRGRQPAVRRSPMPPRPRRHRVRTRR